MYHLRYIPIFWVWLVAEACALHADAGVRLCIQTGNNDDRQELRLKQRRCLEEEEEER